MAALEKVQIRIVSLSEFKKGQYLYLTVKIEAKFALILILIKHPHC